MAGYVKAWQSGSAGQIISTRAAVMKVVAFHSANEDEVVSFYDLEQAPSNGETAYEWHLYGKGVFELTIPEDGVIFENGIYVDPGENAVVTVFYRSV